MLQQNSSATATTVAVLVVGWRFQIFVANATYFRKCCTCLAKAEYLSPMMNLVRHCLILLSVLYVSKMLNMFRGTLNSLPLIQNAAAESVCWGRPQILEH